MDRDGALTIIDGLYAAALGEAEWKPALAKLADGLAGSATTLEIHDVASRTMLAFESVRLDPALASAYAEYYVQISPRVKFLRRSTSVITFDHMYISEQEMDRDPFYAELLTPQALRYFIAAQTPVMDGAVKAVIAVQRSGRMRGADMAQIRAMRLLAPHVVRALKLYWARIHLQIDSDYLDRNLARHGLTQSERRLAAAIAVGDALSDYAKRNGLSINTVYTHYRRLKEKMNAANQAALVAQLCLLARDGSDAVSPAQAS